MHLYMHPTDHFSHGQVGQGSRQIFHPVWGWIWDAPIHPHFRGWTCVFVQVLCLWVSLDLGLIQLWLLWDIVIKSGEDLLPCHFPLVVASGTYVASGYLTRPTWACVIHGHVWFMDTRLRLWKRARGMSHLCTLTHTFIKEKSSRVVKLNLINCV